LILATILIYELFYNKYAFFDFLKSKMPHDSSQLKSVYVSLKNINQIIFNS